MRPLFQGLGRGGGGGHLWKPPVQCLHIRPTPNPHSTSAMEDSSECRIVTLTPSRTEALRVSDKLQQVG